MRLSDLMLMETRLAGKDLLHASLESRINPFNKVLILRTSVHAYLYGHIVYTFLQVHACVCVP